MPPVIKLFNAIEGIEYVIDEIFLDDDFKHFLTTIGCYEGETINVINSYNSATIIFYVKGGKYSIDRETAEHIYIRKKELYE